MDKKDFVFFGIVAAFMGIVIAAKYPDFNLPQFWLGFFILCGGAYALWKYGSKQ